MYDYLIKNGNVFLGKYQGWLEADVAIKDEKIVSLKPNIPASEAKEVFSAKNQVVSAGFIDVHTHDEMEILQSGTVPAKIPQGVTTVLLGNCGLGFYPIVEDRKEDLKDYNSGIFDLEGVEFDWKDLQGFSDKLEKRGLGINAASLVAHGSIRLAVKGFDDSKATDEELKLMGQLLQEALNQGAAGMSTGLLYPPSSYANQKEIEYLVSILAENNKIYTTHLRNESDELEDCIKENIELARKTGVKVEISHLNLSGKEIWGESDYILALFDKAREEGLDIHADQYPYQAGSTLITALLPQWSMVDGVENLLDHLKNTSCFREKLTEDIETGILNWDNIIKSAGWDNIIVNSVPKESMKRYQNKSLREIADLMGEDFHDALYNLIIEGEGRITILIFSTSQDDVDNILANPDILVGSDGLTINGHPHPRLYGTYPKILGEAVREKEILSLETALDKMTRLPANKFGFDDRGTIAEGKYADIVVFDPDVIEAKATYERPSQLAKGVNLLLINGEPVYKDGKYLDDNKPGKFIRLF